MALMAGRRGLVMGVANDHSIAWGIAKTLAEQRSQAAKLGLPSAVSGGAPASDSQPAQQQRSETEQVASAVTELASSEEYEVSGAIIEAVAMESVLNVLLAITTALLGVAVLIALIGVSNTLGLSVLERTRESALMRALGLQARSLRLMLLIEALLLAVVGVAVGVAARDPP